MVWRSGGALLGITVLVFLAGCVGTPEALPTPKTADEACADLEVAVREFYDIASPNATITELKHSQLPEVHGFIIPKPTCSFEVRPDPSVLPGDRFTLENFYLDYDEEITLLMKERLEAAGYAQKQREILNWTATRLGTFYSASMLVFLENDEQPYSEAADGTVLDLTISQG
jgi:hypothetical protein